MGVLGMKKYLLTAVFVGSTLLLDDKSFKTKDVFVSVEYVASVESIWHWCDGLVGSVVVVFSWRVAEARANIFFGLLLSAWFHFQLQAMIVLEKKLVLGKKERLCCSVLHLQCGHFGCSFQFYRLSATRSVDLLDLNFFDLRIKTVYLLALLASASLPSCI